jgi:hypothetical protein
MPIAGSGKRAGFKSNPAYSVSSTHTIRTERVMIQTFLPYMRYSLIGIRQAKNNPLST